MRPMMRHIALICVAMTLAGCASTGGMFGSRSSEPAEPSLAPETSALSAAEIQKALAGKPDTEPADSVRSH